MKSNVNEVIDDEPKGIMTRSKTKTNVVKGEVFKDSRKEDTSTKFENETFLMKRKKDEAYEVKHATFVNE